MDNIANEELKKYGAKLLRWAIVAICTQLIKKNLIDQPTIDALTTPEVLAAIIGIIGIGVLAVKGWWKTRYDVALAKAAYHADASTTTFETVKTEVKSRL